MENWEKKTLKTNHSLVEETNQIIGLFRDSNQTRSSLNFLTRIPTELLVAGVARPPPQQWT